MLISLLNFNTSKFNIQQNQTKSCVFRQQNLYQQDIFKRNNQISFAGKLLLFEDIAKLIKKGDISAIERLTDPHVVNAELQSLLHVAAEERQVEISRHLLGRGLNVNQKDKRGRTPFSIACTQQDEPTIDLFFDFSPDINTQDNLGNTPLHNALPNHRILGKLLDRRANPYLRNSFGLPILHEAAADLETLEYLLKRGVNPNSINDEEQSLMHVAAIDGNPSLAEKLLEYNAEINFRDKDGKTPIFYSRDNDTLSYLLEKGANTDIQDNAGKVALHQFVIKRDLKSTSELLEFFASPNIADKTNKTPILYASNNTIRKLLLEYGADSNVMTSKGNTLLHIAVQKYKKEGDEEVINTLLHYKANPNILDKNKKSPLFYATNNKVRKILLENGADPNSELYLHWSLKTNNKEFFDDLLKAKAKVNIEDSNGKTPIFYCKDEEDIIKLLKNNASIEHEDKNLNTPLHHYCLTGNTKIASLLAELGADTKAINNNGETPYDLLKKFQQYDCWIK